MNPANPPSDLSKYAVNRAGAFEVVWQPYYDILTYDAAGDLQLTFFQRTVGSSGITLASTNMRAAGAFPQPVKYLVTGIQLFYIPSGDASVTATAAAAQANINEVTSIFDAGYLEFIVGSKTYLRDAPLGKFTAQFTYGFGTALAGTFASGTYIATDFARNVGRYYAITPTLIPPNQNFSVSANWDTKVAVAGSSQFGCILDGFEYRLSQ